MADTKNKKSVPLTEEQISQKESDLNTQSEKLNSDIKEFENFQETVFKEKEDLAAEKKAFESEKNSSLQFIEEERFKLKSGWEDLETAKADFEAKKASFSEENTSNEPEPEKVVEFDFEGDTVVFTNDAPKKISIDGKGYTQQEIAEDPNLALALIGGQSGLIIKKL